MKHGSLCNRGALRRIDVTTHRNAPRVRLRAKPTISLGVPSRHSTVYEYSGLGGRCSLGWKLLHSKEGHQPRAHPCAGVGHLRGPLAKATGCFRTRITEASIPPHLRKHTLHSEVDAKSPVSGQTLPATVFPQVANPQTRSLSTNSLRRTGSHPVAVPLSSLGLGNLPFVRSGPSQGRFRNFIVMGLLVGHVGLPMFQCPDLQVILHPHEDDFILQLCQRR